MRARHLEYLLRLGPTRPAKESSVTDGLNRKQRRRFEAKKREATTQVLHIAKEQLRRHPKESHEEVRVEGEVGEREGN